MATINDLQYELFSYIMILLVQSSDGAANLARTMSVCREFLRFAEDINILKAVVFDDVSISNRYHLFQQIHGLMNKCAQAENVAAQFLFAKIILLSSSQLLVMEAGTFDFVSVPGGHAVLGLVRAGKIPKDGIPTGSFMTHFLPDQASTSKASQKSLVHYQLVKLFLRHCSPHDLAEMGTYLNCYIEYFARSDNEDNLLLHEAVNHMCAFATRVRSMKELGEIKGKLDGSIRVLKEIGTKVNESCDDPSCKTQRQKALVEASSRGGATVAELTFRCSEDGVDYEGLFGVDADAETFKKYFEEVCNLFEQSRANAVFAFEIYFP